MALILDGSDGIGDLGDTLDAAAVAATVLTWAVRQPPVDQELAVAVAVGMWPLQQERRRVPPGVAASVVVGARTESASSLTESRKARHLPPCGAL
jgi:hypothetical protein